MKLKAFEKLCQQEFDATWDVMARANEGAGATAEQAEELVDQAFATVDRITGSIPFSWPADLQRPYDLAVAYGTRDAAAKWAQERRMAAFWAEGKRMADLLAALRAEDAGDPRRTVRPAVTFFKSRERGLAEGSVVQVWTAYGPDAEKARAILGSEGRLISLSFRKLLPDEKARPALQLVEPFAGAGFEKIARAGYVARLVEETAAGFLVAGRLHGKAVPGNVVSLDSARAARLERAGEDLGPSVADACEGQG